MTLIKKGVGKVVYALGQLLSFVFNLFIGIAEFAVNLVIGIARGLAALISMGGCLLLFFLFNPLVLFNPITILVILFFLIFPILGTKFISFLKYWRYIITEYLFDLGNYLMDGKGTHKSFSEYGHKYQSMEEERIRKEREKRQQQQQKEWEERFSQWQNYQQQRGNYGGQYQQGQYQGAQYANPMTEFKSKYNKSCDLLGLPYDTDKYQVKLAYRKKAKENHPDLNKSPDATQKFQKINEAYEFLSDENIERYKQMKG
ncbi:MAG: DnaJ domain-containing protein [Gudongella sp.]|nr:DnaJ domain-containing protein [Gudongella sp.]